MWWRVNQQWVSQAQLLQRGRSSLKFGYRTLSKANLIESTLLKRLCSPLTLKIMAKENESDLDSLNQVPDEVIELEDNDDIDALKEKFQKVNESHQKLTETNKQLFARAKKAEGYELKDGKWVKPPKKEEPKVDVEPSKEPSKPSDLDYGQKAFLKTYGIQGSDELALVKSFQTRTGDDLDTIVSDDIFLGKLKSLRDARESANAIPKGKQRSGQTAVNDADLAFAKYKETGELPIDFETRNKVVDMISAEEKGPMFNFK